VGAIEVAEITVIGLDALAWARKCARGAKDSSNATEITIVTAAARSGTRLRIVIARDFIT
jgi:hypothetical protein